MPPACEPDPDRCEAAVACGRSCADAEGRSVAVDGGGPTAVPADPLAAALADGPSDGAVQHAGRLPRLLPSALRTQARARTRVRTSTACTPVRTVLIARIALCA